MEKKSEKHANLQNVKKELEAAAGQKLDVTHDQIISLRWPVGAHDTTDGTVLWRSIFFPGHSCVASPLIDASGGSYTGTDGSVTFLLSSSVCLPAVRSLAAPINLQATVRSTTPAFLTMEYTLIADPSNPQNHNDVQITVRTWDANGAAAAGIGFDWRCRLVSNPIIF